MRPFPSWFRRTILSLLLTLLFLSASCYCDYKSVDVVGTAECFDCKLNNIKLSQAVSGLQVIVACKLADGKLKIKGVGKLSSEGKFRVSLPVDVVKTDGGGQLKEDCFAQLSVRCTSKNGVKAMSKISYKSKNNGRIIFGLTENLIFSPVICSAAKSVRDLLILFGIIPKNPAKTVDLSVPIIYKPRYGPAPKFFRPPRP